VIQLEEISKAYGGQQLFRGLTWRIPDGERIGLVGPNGAGKTTLFNLLSGQYRPSAGRVVFKGEDVTRLGAAARARRGIGRSFQLTNVFPTLTVLENVRMAVQARRLPGLHAWRDARRFAELEDRAYAILESVLLEAKWDAPASALAHGEKRKLEVGILNPHNQTPSRVLLQHASFVKQIRAGALRASQFPDELTDSTGLFRKPRVW